MHINVTEGDIFVAKTRARVDLDTKESYEHAWHNPIAVAIERLHGGFAWINDDFCHVESVGFVAKLKLTDVARSYMRDWRNGAAHPVQSLFIGR